MHFICKVSALVGDVQGVGDAIAHEDDEAQHLEHAHGPAHEDLLQSSLLCLG